MFDLTRMRTLNLDQLNAYECQRLTQDAEATNGRVYPRGTDVWFSYAFVNVHTQDAEIHVEDQDAEEAVFLTKSGEHRRMFERLGRVGGPVRKQEQVAAPEPPPPPPAPAPPPVVQQPAEPAGPPLPPDPRIEWLSEQPGCARAAEILQGKYSPLDWGSTRRDADELRLAARLFVTTQPEVAKWLAGRSLTFYHCWMSQATSGGEGTAMMYQIRDELKEVRKLARE